MIKSAAAAALLLAAVPAAAAEPNLPTEPWPRAVACSSHLFLIISNAEAKGANKTSVGALRVLKASLGNWYSAASAMEGYSKERFGQELEAYVSGPLGSGEGALANEVRQANAEVCVNEAVTAEMKAYEDKKK